MDIPHGTSRMGHRLMSLRLSKPSAPPMARTNHPSSKRGGSLPRPSSGLRIDPPASPPREHGDLAAHTIQARLAATMRRLSGAFVAASAPPPVRDPKAARILAEQTRHLMLLHTTFAVTAQATVQPAHALLLLDEPGSARDERLDLQERRDRPTDEARPTMRPVSRNAT